MVSVVVSACREAANLSTMIPRLCVALQHSGLPAEIIVVDDDSPDATLQVMEELSGDFPVRLIVRRGERGVPSAVIRGLHEARGRVLVCMDSNRSHPPELVPDLVTAVLAEQGDFVIGSRCVAGGRTDWRLFHRLNATMAALLALPLTRAKDPLAGFFALRRDMFRKAERLDPVGGTIGLEILVKAGCRRVHEVPTHFRDRMHDECELSLRAALNYLRHLMRLYRHRLGRLAQPLLFLAVGGSGMIVDLLVLSVLLLWIDFRLARAAAIGVAMTWNFVLNRRFTFLGARSAPLLRQYALFCLSCGLGAIVNWSVSTWLWSRWAGMLRFPAVAALAGIAAGVVLNYALSARLVFRPAGGNSSPPN